MVKQVVIHDRWPTFSHFGPTEFVDTILPKVYIGYDKMADRLDKLKKDLETKSNTGYPPHNIIKNGETEYKIEIAIAGFKHDNVTIEVAEGTLTIKGEVIKDKDADYLFRGIANRSFTKQFTLDEEIVVQDAVLVDGMLTITLARVVPDHKKPKLIKIKGQSGDVKPITKPDLLVEG